MKMQNIPTGLQEKNDQDFVEVTRRIQDGLELIESDPKLKATQSVLAKLANCSRGTLNNRKWPLEQLKSIKLARKEAVRMAVNETTAAAKEETRIERYKEQLYNSREEILLWKNRHDVVTQQLSQLHDLNRVLQTRLQTAENMIIKLQHAASTKIVEIVPKRSK